MIDTFDLYRSLQANVNPSQSGHIRPQENFIRWVNAIQEELFEELVRKVGVNRTIDEKLSPFLVSANITVPDSPGQPFDRIQKPTDFRYFASASFVTPTDGVDNAGGCGCKEFPVISGHTGEIRYQDEDDQELKMISAGSTDRSYPISLVDTQRWAAVNSHIRKGPTLKAPKMAEYNSYFELAPRRLGIIVMNYYRSPKPATFSYTLGPNDQIIYNEAGSEKLEWSRAMIPEFLARLAIRYGIYVKEDLAYQSGQLARTQTKA